MSEMETEVEDVSAPTEFDFDQTNDSDDATITDGTELSGPSDRKIQSAEGMDQTNDVVDADDGDDDGNFVNEEVEEEEEEDNETDNLVIDNAVEDDEDPHRSDDSVTSAKEERDGPGMTDVENITKSNGSPTDTTSESDSSPVKASSDSSLLLPECKNKRSYVCGYCNIVTNNPRVYLHHLKDSHKETMKIYECSRCIYASRTHQKLLRHGEMVHKAPFVSSESKEVTPIKIKRKYRKKIKEHLKEKTAFSPMNRSPRESKSPRRFEEYEFQFPDDKYFEIDDEMVKKSVDNVPEVKPVSVGKSTLQCDECDFSCSYEKILAKHNAKCHSKEKRWKCRRCNYTTNVRARYAKHMKYHTLKIVKCEFCDFRTPYPWNMDRHNKNHTEDNGEFKCHLCNFSAQIKQSLTVHIVNHHLTPEQIRERESKRTIGVTDDCDDMSFVDDENELLRMERDEDPESLEIPSTFAVSSIDMGNQEELDGEANNEDNSSVISKPKIKITLKKMKSPKSSTANVTAVDRYNYENDFVHPDDVVQRNGDIYIKSEKCSLCSFKAPFQHEIVRHKKKVHGIHSLKKAKLHMSKKAKVETLIKSSRYFTDDGLMKNSFSDLSKFVNETAFFKEDETIDKEKERKIINIRDEPPKQEGSTQKKKSSFFDKLQEKLSISNVQNLVCQFCGHESKCLSESVRHQKLHLSAKNSSTTSSLSTRCQFCRHRCKTTDDLINHLKSCPEARKNQISDNMKDKMSEKLSYKSNEFDSDDGIRHPMENKVFVWNSISNPDEEDRTDSPAGNASDSNLNDALESRTNDSSKAGTSKVYRCPQCSFRSTTASRFHVHMVGHYNIKPYSCTECAYRSNWRWDITKHIKLKVVKDRNQQNSDRNHEHAEVLLSNDTLIQKNYEKYDVYLTEVSRDEIHHSEGGLSNSRKGPSRRNLQESDGSDSAKSSPCPTPNPSNSNKLPAPPKLTRAPSRLSNPLEPLLAGDTQKPPPLVAMASQLVNDRGSTSSGLQEEINNADQSPPDLTNNQTILSQTGTDKMSTSSLETLQLLASGSTNLARLKRQQQETGEGKDPELDAAIANQMRLLLWLNCLVGGAEKKESDANNSSEVAAAPPTPATVQVTGNGNSVGESPLASVPSSGPSNIMQLILDHEGNPEWKCTTCEFRDNEQETVSQHVRLAHGKKGSVSLVHAVHRCSVCGFAAGTKRHVQVHLEQAHNGQGGIISRSEGQNIDVPVNGAEERTYDCRMCPFKCKKKGELKNHLSHHTTRSDFVFKCMFCTYFVATKDELFSHLALHGMDIPASSKESSDSVPTNVNVTSKTVDDGGARQFTCDMCPFETRIRAKMMHHRQFHRPRGLPFSCPHCSYNVTRRHLLTQHLRIHGVSPADDNEESANPTVVTNLNHKANPFASDPMNVRKSPSPSLTITPISNLGPSSLFVNSSALSINPSCLPNLSDELTKNLHDIPLVWVSRDNRFFKMFKCRHCPHVNLRKTNIQEHEKMHRPEGLVPGTGHTCNFCTYVCINAGVMSAHIKVHSGSMGVCHAISDPAMANDDQLKMLAKSNVNVNKGSNLSDEKVLYYCQHCPSRFFLEKEVQIHSRFHSMNYPCLCDKCNFKAREDSQVLAHAKVHTSEYQERTRTLMLMHPPAPNFPPVPGLSVPADKPVFGVKDTEVNNCKSSDSNGLSRPWLATVPLPIGPKVGQMPQPPPTSRFKCDLCPSSFTKQITLQYHQSLHGADNPYGCSRCNYSAKTSDGLQQHSALHDQVDLEKSSNSSFRSSTPSPAPSPSPQKILENALGLVASNKNLSVSRTNVDQPPIKLKFIGLKGNGSSSKSMKKQQFKYYIEEQVPLSGIELLKRKHQIEQELPKDANLICRPDILVSKPLSIKQQKLSEERSGNPELNYPLHIDKISGKTREKRYKCLKCPSAFDKMDQFNVHINLHGTKYKYKCKLCNYTVKFYANFMMHIKRHKYHENVNAQNKGLPLPRDDDDKFEPTIGLNIAREEFVPLTTPLQDKENVYDFDKNPGMTMAEKQQLLLQAKKVDSSQRKDDDKDRRVFYCQYCPYASVRRDGVDSHSLRHQANGGKGLYQCNFCDYTASGPNFIREHTKVHFRPFKHVRPEGFMRHDKLELWSIKSGEELQLETDEEIVKKSQVFCHEEGVFGPTNETETAMEGNEEKDDETRESGILVDFRSGDVIDAPNTFIIPLKQSKAKGSSPSNYSSVKGPKSKNRKARKHTKLKSSSNHSDSMDFEESASDVCNGESPSVNGTSSPAESTKQDDDMSDESNQYMEGVNELPMVLPAMAN